MRFYPRIILAQKIILAFGLFVLFGYTVIPAMPSERFADHGNGTVTDTKTGLMWAAKDNGNPINWKDALSYCQIYNDGGYTDWRMPTIAELASLYDPEAVNRNGYHLSRLITTSAQSCWASETRGNLAARFNFTHGDVYWLRQFYSGPTRVLPVRDRK